jgi:2-methylisocitrate lyase-like PEP mutase family enzyme
LALPPINTLLILVSSIKRSHSLSNLKQVAPEFERPSAKCAHQSGFFIINRSSATMSDFNFGGTDEESAEIKKLNAEVVRYLITR